MPTTSHRTTATRKSGPRESRARCSAGSWEAGWVRPAGRREGPGRPLLYATTQGFLTHFGLQSRRDLPGIDDLKAAGLLDPLEATLGDVELESADGSD